MDRNGWLPCRLVPFDGRSSGTRAGPDTGHCTYAGWSPDGRWMYFSSDASGSFQLWRQRFPNGRPEQLTFGPTESEGIAISPDGASLITSTGLEQRSVWLHEHGVERQVSSEGQAVLPAWGDGFPTSVFSPDGKRLYYLAQKRVQRGFGGGELWMADLAAGSTEPLFPGLSLTSYDISPDGTQIVFAALAADGKSKMWLARTDRRVAPRQISNEEALGPVFLGSSGEICFRGREGQLSYLYALNLESGRTRKLVPDPALDSPMVSPDGQWIVSANPAVATDKTAIVKVYSREGGPSQVLCQRCFVRWTRDQKFLFLGLGTGAFSFSPGSTVASARTIVVPLAPGKAWPELPPLGFKADSDVQNLPGAKMVGSGMGRFPGLDAETWAFEKQTVQRNLYRITLP